MRGERPYMNNETWRAPIRHRACHSHKEGIESILTCTFWRSSEKKEGESPKGTKGSQLKFRIDKMRWTGWRVPYAYVLLLLVWFSRFARDIRNIWQIRRPGNWSVILTRNFWEIYLREFGWDVKGGDEKYNVVSIPLGKTLKLYSFRQSAVDGRNEYQIWSVTICKVWVGVRLAETRDLEVDTTLSEPREENRMCSSCGDCPNLNTPPKSNLLIVFVRVRTPLTLSRYPSIPLIAHSALWMNEGGCTNCRVSRARILWNYYVTKTSGKEAEQEKEEEEGVEIDGEIRLFWRSMVEEWKEEKDNNWKRSRGEKYLGESRAEELLYFGSWSLIDTWNIWKPTTPTSIPSQLLENARRVEKN